MSISTIAPEPRLNAEAGRLAQRLEAGVINFDVADGVLEALAAKQAALVEGSRPRMSLDEAAEPKATYTAAQERAMLLAMARDAEGQLTRSAIHNRTHGGLDQPAVIDARAVVGERAIGFVYELLATRGSSARVEATDKAAMAARGMSPDLIGFVERETAFQARRDRATSWLLGPERAYFAGVLCEAGAAVTDANVVALRGAYLALYAELLFDAERRYAAATSSLDQVLAMLREETRPRDVSDAMAPAVAHPAPRPTIPEEPDQHARSEEAAPSRQAAVAGQGPIEAGTGLSFTGRVATLAKRKIKLKLDGQPDGWSDKTADRHHSTAALFVKRVGTDDPTRMGQADVGRYRDLLDLLPKNWGKSSKDALRSLEDILARCEDLDEDEVGLAPNTVNRHLAQLGNRLTNLKGHGCIIGEVTEGMRTHGKGRPRATFTEQDAVTLFGAATWTGSAVEHRSSYFVPLFAKYQVMRLSEITGLLPEDFDLDQTFFHVRPNRLRGLKNESSVRRLPIMPELERLGLCEYVEAIRRLDLEVLWPELLRGTATPVQNLYHKSWSSLVTAVLPGAAAERKHMHSWRKAGNRVLASKNINDPLRYQILGHAYRDVNGRHYTDELSLADKRAALGLIGEESRASTGTGVTFQSTSQELADGVQEDLRSL